MSLVTSIILGYLEEHKARVASIQEFLKDTKIELNERWDVYLKVQKLLPVGYFSGLRNVGISDNRFSMYDDFYKDRYSTVKYEHIVDIILDETKTPKSDKWSNLDLNLIKASILSLGLQGFVYDW